jgi:parvulin-like peptidyl-prolyl isomerase
MKFLPIVLTQITLATFSLTNLHAGVIDAIAIDVNGEPITTLEIQAVQQKLNMSKDGAIEALIKDRLEKSAIENAEINIEEREIDEKITQIATSRAMSKEQMQTMLTQKGLTWQSYREQLSNEMKKEIFYRKFIASTIEQPSEHDLKLYYETHKEQFKAPASMISLVAYSASTPEKLQEALKNPDASTQGVKKENLLLGSNELAPQLLSIIDKTPQNGFTQTIHTGNDYISYLVKSKTSTTQSGFESVKNAVLAQWMEEQRAKSGGDFYNRLKKDAKIKVIRL